MKSKKANEFLEENRICDEVLITEAVVAVNIAEKEMEERAIEAFKRQCQYHVNDDCEYGDCKCDMRALYCANFIKMLRDEDSFS